MIKYYFILLLPVVLLSGCTSSIGVMATAKDGEYVSVARNMAGPFSSLELAQQEAIDKATEYCSKMGLSYKKLYAIDRPMAIAQAPESTLYFTCITMNNKESADSSKTEVLNNNADKGKMIEDQLYVKLSNLRKLLDNGTITKEEFEREKGKILNQK